jgi:hypothetical protein
LHVFYLFIPIKARKFHVIVKLGDRFLEVCYGSYFRELGDRQGKTISSPINRGQGGYFYVSNGERIQRKIREDQFTVKW